MTSSTARIGYATVAFLSVGVALYSFRFAGVFWNIWPLIGPEIAGVVKSVPFQALTHMLIAPIALLVGPFQFWAGLRSRQPALHRFMGRTYVAACTIAGIAALATAPFASGGPVAGLGFGILAVLWVSTTLAAANAAMQRNFVRHRRLMRYSFAMTFGAVTLRLQIPIGIIFFHFSSYGPLSVWLAYTSWIPNVIAVWMYNTLRRSRDVGGMQPAAA
jgi:uncharacterized membrane protein